LEHTQVIHSKAQAFAPSKINWFLAYGDSPLKPLRESTSANSIKAQNEKEIEALRKKVLYQSTEYDKLLEKLNSSEHECKSYQMKIENLEVSYPYFNGLD